MTDPMHLSSFVPGALNELLGMIERGERERENDCEKKENDLRFLDPKGCVVGLIEKGRAKKDSSGFVLEPSNN
jgi:hypothetical protein